MDNNKGILKDCIDRAVKDVFGFATFDDESILYIDKSEHYKSPRLEF